MSVEIQTNLTHITEKNYKNMPQMDRVPVECSDSEENLSKDSKKVNTDKVIENLKNFKITNGTDNENDLEKEICSKLSKVTLKDKIESKNDVEVVVDSIKREEECKNVKAKDSKVLGSRGPSGGKATSYAQAQYQSNYQNSCSYYQSSQYGGYDNQYCNMTSGKRRPDYDDDIPYKYQTPNIVPQNFNNLNMPLNIQPEKVTHKRHMSGGVMSVQNSFMVPDTKVPFSPFVPTEDDAESCNFDFMNTIIDENFENRDQNFSLPPYTEMQKGHRDSFSTDCQSEGYSSPGHESTYSTMGIDSPPPLSNMSEDSGISSPDNRNSDVASPCNMSVSSGSPKNNVYAPSLVTPRSYINIDTSNEPTGHFTNDQQNCEGNQVVPSSSDLDWEDLMDVVKKDTIIMEEKERKRQRSGNLTNALNTNIRDNLAITPNMQSTVAPAASNGNVMRPFNSVNNPATQPVQLPQQQPVFSTKPLIQTAPVNNMAAPVSVTLAPLVNSNPCMPVSTGQILLIAPAPQPVFVVNQTPRFNTQAIAKKPAKTNYVPIRPKLDPVTSKGSPSSESPANSPKTNDTKSQVPSVPASDQGNSNTQSPPSTQDNNKSTSSKRLNKARRLVAQMTSKDLRYQDDKGDTYLHVAVCKDDPDITNFVQALLERLDREKLIGMIDIVNIRRQTPLYCAVCANHPEIVEMLIKYGADVNILAERMVQGGEVREITAAIHVAVSNGKDYLETLNALLKSKEINLNIANSDGYTALHSAILCHNKAKQGSTECIDSTPIIETLIQHDADISAQDKKSGKTPLMYALESRSLHLIYSVVKHIKQEKMRVYLRTQSFDGNTPQKILESLKSVLDLNSWQKVHDMLLCSKNKVGNGSTVNQ